MLLAVVVLMVAVHVYVGWRLVWGTTSARPVRLVGLVVLVTGAALAILSVRALLAVSYPQWLARTGFPWVAVVCYLAAWLAVLEPVRLVGVLGRHRVVSTRHRDGAASGDRGGLTQRGGDVGAPEAMPEPRPPAWARREVLSRGLAASALLATGVTVGAGARSAFGPPEVHKAMVPIPRLPSELSGLRLSVLADTHLWPFLDGRDLRRAVDLINDQEPDLVVFAGDLADAPVARMGEEVASLAELRPSYGTFFVTGNHEYYRVSGALGKWLEHLQELGVRVLRNERVTIGEADARLDLAGVTDEAGRDHGDPPDYEAALGGRDETVPVILAAHTPSQVFQAADYGVDLQVSGHTHGGQSIPINLLRARENPVQSGLARVDSTWLYVTNGVGFYGPPIRVGIPPRIGLLTLVETPEESRDPHA